MANYDKSGLFGFEFAHKEPVDKRNKRTENEYQLNCMIYPMGLRGRGKISKSKILADAREKFLSFVVPEWAIFFLAAYSANYFESTNYLDDRFKGKFIEPS
jgi:hypothetical protein